MNERQRLDKRVGRLATLTKLGGLAVEVANQDAEYQEAIAGEQEAEIELLELVIKAVKPALDSICSKIVIRRNNDGKLDHTNVEGVCLTRDKPGPDIGAPECHPSSERPISVDVFLLSSGKLLEASYHGNMSFWYAKTEELAPKDFVADHDLEEALARLEMRMTAQLHGRKSKNTTKARDRTERLRALLKAVG